jgi:catechol 2,3-dioxygenase-like lactoylglutathione lyase family enzyme
VNAPPDVLITREIFPKLPKKKFFGTPGGRSAYFHDPDGNALEIIHLTNRAKG